MNRILGILAVAAILFGFYWLRATYLERQAADPEAYRYGKEPEAPPTLDERQLPGLEYKYEQSLSLARQRGAEGLKLWLNTYNHLVQDPRKAYIQLDYVNLIALKNPAEARALFAEVKQRTPRESPVWPRIEKMAPTFE